MVFTDAVSGDYLQNVILTQPEHVDEVDDVAERNCPDVEEQSPEVVLKSSRVLQPEDEDVAGYGYEVEVDQDL